MQEAAQLRRFSRWAAIHAWKLAGLTALFTFVGVFIAVTLSLVLRPTRSYFFPLLSDVDKHQPEGSILRVAFVTVTALLFATTTASILHCQSLRLFVRDRSPGESVDMLCRYEDTSEIIPSISPTKRRFRRFTTVQMTILIPLAATILLTFLQYSGFITLLFSSLHRQYVIKFAIYALCTTWGCAVCFLVWYFLKLQNMPDRAASHVSLLSIEAPVIEPTFPDVPVVSGSLTFSHTFKSWASWVIVILRPVCLTGQVVCVIKIAGLWLALDTFTISNIRLVKIALLAALAFAEYTAAFFFAFFMTILAVDMRSKASLPDISVQG